MTHAIRRRFRVIACSLSVLAFLAIATQAHAETVIRLRFVTGGDDLRGGDVGGTGNNVYLQFVDRHGRVLEELRNGNKSATWGGGSVNDVTLLDVGRVGEFASVRISVSDRNKADIFEQADGWNLDALRIAVVVDGVERTLLDQRGSPLARFTAGAAPQEFALSRVEDNCAADTDCNDDQFCNGTERCVVNREPGVAVLRRCMPSSAAFSCAKGLVCDESVDACRLSQVDADGDGYVARESGGDDCDDDDPRRYPGNSEVCDHEHLDEDCDLSTGGLMDVDGDGHTSSNCFNWGPPRP